MTIIALTTLAGTQSPLNLSTASLSAAGSMSGSVSLESSSNQLAPDIERLKVGDTIKDFKIPTQYAPNGEKEVSLSTLLQDGPVVVTFFRGSWCPYCRDELSDIQDNLKKFEQLNTNVIAISPEVSEKGSEMAKDLELGFYVAHDENNDLARSLGLTFKLDAKTIKKYREYNINVARSNGTRKWELPVPATYVIDQDFVVRYVYDDEDYSKRADTKKVLKVIKDMQSED
ncbi:MAG: AhpC/TSA family protein [Phycisphaerales bacterium]|nr:AhpC/TSA family protein [Phycisphaerales bacterium]